MFKLKSLTVIGISALVAGAAVSFSGDFGAGFFGKSAASAGTAATAGLIDRTRKSDRLTVDRQRSEPRTISAVEVVGIRDAAIIYRDREGRVLYQTDPLTNATLVTKGVVLPEVTVRETSRSAVRPVTTTVPAKAAPTVNPTVESRDQIKPARSVPSTERRQRIPEGCDPAASPIAAPQLAHILSKCLVEAPTTVKLAALY
jgi:hypothetical protein